MQVQNTERVLVTGGAGFLGLNHVRKLLAAGYEVSSTVLATYDYSECIERIDIHTVDFRIG